MFHDALADEKKAIALTIERSIGCMLGLALLSTAACSGSSGDPFTVPYRHGPLEEAADGGADPDAAPSEPTAEATTELLDPVPEPIAPEEPLPPMPGSGTASCGEVLGCMMDSGSSDLEGLSPCMANACPEAIGLLMDAGTCLFGAFGSGDGDPASLIQCAPQLLACMGHSCDGGAPTGGSPFGF